MRSEPRTTTTKLPLFSRPSSSMVDSPEHPGMLTPPLQTLASVPFRWEQEPGKPRPCTDLITLPKNSIFDEPKCLEPPPRLYLENTKTPSPTTVLDGPYITAKSKIYSSSFRFFKDGGSLDSPETGKLSSAKNRVRRGNNWWQRKGGGGRNRETGVGGNFVFPSLTECGSDSDEGSSCSTVKMATLKRNGSSSSLSQTKPQIWVSIYEGLKQVIPWKSRKSKKEVIID